MQSAILFRENDKIGIVQYRYKLNISLNICTNNITFSPLFSIHDWLNLGFGTYGCRAPAV